MNLKASDVADVIDAVELALKDDLVSWAEFRQLIENVLSDTQDVWPHVEKLLGLLLMADVEIGNAVCCDRPHIKFIAWRGGVENRVERAKIEIERHSEQDRAFAFWLCLRASVDEFEEL
jgi:hypothetical protein